MIHFCVLLHAEWGAQKGRMGERRERIRGRGKREASAELQIPTGQLALEKQLQFEID